MVNCQELVIRTIEFKYTNSTVKSNLKTTYRTRKLHGRTVYDPSRLKYECRLYM